VARSPSDIEGVSPSSVEKPAPQILGADGKPIKPAGLSPLRVVSGSSCFAAGTPLLTPEGSRLIEQFQPGDSVLSRAESEPNGPPASKAVEAVFVRLGRILHVHIGGQVIRTTSEHPFWVVGVGWRKAGKLVVGDPLLGHDGRTVLVDDLLDTGEYERVYNLRVADHHTYFVGCQEWGFSVWAHNSCVELVEVDGKFHLVELSSRKVVYTGMTANEAVAFAEENGFDLGIRGLKPEQIIEPSPTANPNAPRPAVKNPSGSDPRVTHELPLGEERSPQETAAARKYYENHKDKAIAWWEERWGRKWPQDATHGEHPRGIKEGGDPLFIEPGFGGSNPPHSVIGPDGLTDQQRWGIIGGKIGGRGRPKPP
jgi:hypothetical protein